MVLTINHGLAFKGKRTGQIVEDQRDKLKIIKLYIYWIIRTGSNHKAFVNKTMFSLIKINIPLDKFIHFYIHNQNFIHIKGG